MCNKTKVRKLIKQINMNEDLNEMPEYRVTETSSRHGENTYNIYNLEVEYENGEIYFGDLEEKIIASGYALMGFLVSSVKDIIIECNVIEIFFEINSIKIEFL